MTPPRRARVLKVEPADLPEPPTVSPFAPDELVPLTVAPAGGAAASVALFLASLALAAGFTGYVTVRALSPEPPPVPLR